MQLHQRRQKNLQLHKLQPFTGIISLPNFDLLKGDISFYASFLQLLNFFLFLMHIVYSAIL